MTSNTHSHGNSTSLVTGAQDIRMIKEFIGAVEDEWQLYSDRPADYTIGPPIGFGASSIVYAAVYHPSSSSAGTPCALKVLDLDTLAPRSLQLLQRETTLMSLSKHPNVLRVRGSWMVGHRLHIALRLMNKGSAADVMRYGWPGGMEEDVVRCILRQALSGLNYLHVNGFIHRDVKAANLLIDDDGTVLLGDLGVAADLAEDTSHIQPSSFANKSHYSTTSDLSESKPLSASGLGISSSKHSAVFNEVAPYAPRPPIGKRKSFVGTPCWMAPELIQGRQYDSAADIWSFGITALELTQGRPPRSRESPQRVLLRIIQEDPPTLDREGGVYKYSRAFKEIVDSCLLKDPSKRPTAEELLQTPFFRGAKKKSYLVGAILKDLPALNKRQERRVVSRISSANTVESWDFATTVNTPLASTHKRFFSEDFIGDDQENLNISPWARESPEPDLSPIERVKCKINLSSSSGTSNSSNSITNPSSSSSLYHTSVPSSCTESTDPGNEKSSPETKSEPEPLVSMADNTMECTPISSERTPPLPRAPTLSRQFIPPSTTIPVVSASQQGLWRKIKNNVRPSSRGDDEGLDRSSRKKLGGLFSSASNGLLSRQSSRSLANVFNLEGR